ncbi:MAG: hypothetical protein U1D30_10490 [Planctomycetota bacterium]
MNRGIPCALALLLLAFSVKADEAWHPIVPYLSPGKWSEGEKKFAADVPDDQTRFGLGILQILTAFEHLSGGLYEHGFLSDPSMPRSDRGSFFNAKPKPINDKGAGDLIRNFVKDLAVAEATLAGVKDPKIKLKLPIGKLFAEYRASFGRNPLMRFLPMLTEFAPAIATEAVPDENSMSVMVITFDQADVTWLRGYCHILLAFGELISACDLKDWFDRSAHFVFPKVEGPYPFLRQPRSDAFFNDPFFMVDLAAAAVTFGGPVAEPKRLEASLEHFRMVPVLSRRMWSEVRAETDDDHEWIPGPRQKSGPAGAAVTEQMVDAWLAMLDEVAAILDGKLLVPFWRGGGTQGVNLKRAFLESKRLSALDWIQGTAAAPYLEAGPLAKPNVWNRLLDVFGDNVFGYALWFN